MDMNPAHIPSSAGGFSSILSASPWLSAVLTCRSQADLTVSVGAAVLHEVVSVGFSSSRVFGQIEWWWFKALVSWNNCFHAVKEEDMPA